MFCTNLATSQITKGKQGYDGLRILAKRIRSLVKNIFHDLNVLTGALFRSLQMCHEFWHHPFQRKFGRVSLDLHGCRQTSFELLVLSPLEKIVLPYTMVWKHLLEQNTILQKDLSQDF
jgi:hypothetical protein